MTSPPPDGMMRTLGGVRIAARSYAGPAVVITVQGMETAMTIDESCQLRDLLHDAELRAARGDVIT